jgi:hypothetical protein
MRDKDEEEDEDEDEDDHAEPPDDVEARPMLDRAER